MSALDIENETELTSEIDDLSSYLRGVPPDLRESGAFTSYEVRLQQLLETLLTLRLKQMLHRCALAVASHSISSEQRARFDEIQQWVQTAERRNVEAARGYLRVTTLLKELMATLDPQRM